MRVDFPGVSVPERDGFQTDGAALKSGCRYLVAGGAGFIGSNLAHALVRGGASVRILDDLSTGRLSNLRGIEDTIELVHGSLADPETCRRAVQGMDYVLHQAALPSAPRSIDDPRATHDVCATGTLNLLLAARAGGVRRFVYAGSSSAYGDAPVPVKAEGLPAAPRSPYAVSKLAGEQYARVFHDVYGMETVTLRYFNVYGPRQDPTSSYSAVVPLFITKALRGEPPVIHGDGEQTRDFTFVENAVHANLLACHADAPAVAGKMFNVACGTSTSINQLWQAVQTLVGSDLRPIYAAARAGDVRHSLACLRQSRSVLGYEPKVGLMEGLARTLEWFQRQVGTDASPSPPTPDAVGLTA